MAGNMAAGDSDASGGGAVANDYGGTANLKNCAMTANSADLGGAVYIYEGTAYLKDCAMTGNSAGYRWRGGSGLLKVPLSCKHCTMTGNSAACTWRGTS